MTFGTVLFLLKVIEIPQTLGYSSELRTFKNVFMDFNVIFSTLLSVVPRLLYTPCTTMVCEWGKGLEIETRTHRHTERGVVPRMLRIPLYCVSGQLI